MPPKRCATKAANATTKPKATKRSDAKVAAPESLLELHEVEQKAVAQQLKTKELSEDLKVQKVIKVFLVENVCRVPEFIWLGVLGTHPRSAPRPAVGYLQTPPPPSLVSLGDRPGAIAQLRAHMVVFGGVGG